jgi:hypothetical protein
MLQILKNVPHFFTQDVVAVLEKIEAELKKRETKYFCGEEPGKTYY